MSLTFEKELYIKRILYAVMIFIAAALQNTNGALPVFGSAHALVLIPLTVAVSMNEKSIPSMFFGILAGALWDFSSSSIDGYYAIVLCVVAFTCSMLINFVMRNNILSSLMLSFFAITIVTFVSWFLFMALKHYDSNMHALTSCYIPSALYTLAYTPICYYAVKLIAARFKKESRVIG